MLTAASMPMEEEEEAAAAEGDMTYVVPGRTVPGKLDRGNLEGAFYVFIRICIYLWAWLRASLT